MNRRYPIRKLLYILAVGMLALTACNKGNNVETGYFTDARDQKSYQWVRIGSQVWMAENLAWLPSVSPSVQGSDSLPYCYVFRYEGTHVEDALQWEYYGQYGVFYNWTAALNGETGNDSLTDFRVRGVCPEGWHLPSDAEWDTLVNGLGGEYSAGKRMKSKDGWNHYKDESGNGNNSSGFNALPAGSRYSAGGFYNLGFSALFWTSTGYKEKNAWYRYLGYFHNGIYRYFGNRSYGFSVRCIRDDPGF
jgi:uncharacterized protein (TIGR02145 family)